MRKLISLFFALLITACTIPPSQPFGITHGGPQSPLAQPQSQPRSPLIIGSAPVAVRAPLIVATRTVASRTVTRGTVYLPLVGGGSAATPTPAPTATPGAGCGLSPGAAAFFWRLQFDARQQRARLVCDARLVQAAERRAAAQYGDGLSHCDSRGVCANVYVRAAGCKLPSSYAANGNNVEEMAAGTRDAMVIFDALAGSPSHKVHLFGENDFFRKQTRVGIAMIELPSHRYRWIWAVLIAECEDGVSGE